ncbi:MAG TPA: hypothetical protein PL033_21390 [Candidatus Brocadiia bacterium]|nr:hypothetical protein [Candidatus Brocadiia bacterium]
MNGNISQIVSQVVVGNPIELGALTVFPLSWQTERAGRQEVAVLDEGMGTGKVLVEEISEGGSVPELSVQNNLDQDLFILEGEEVRGARQNRVLNISVCIGAKSKVMIPVTCVEQGRWHYKSRRFGSGSRASYRMRKDSSKSVSESAKRGLDFKSDQRLMWENVEKELRHKKSHSPTRAFSDAYDDVAPHIRATLDTVFELPAGTVGVVVALGEKVVSAELFSTPSLFRKMRDKLFRSYAFDAWGIKEGHRRPAREEAEGFLRKAEGTEAILRKSPGRGDQVRLDGKDVTGGALVVDDELAYACLMSSD